MSPRQLTELEDIRNLCYKDSKGWVFRHQETEDTELKESLQLKNRQLSPVYFKDVAAFSNNKGGFLVFGVHDKTFRIKGLKEDRRTLDSKAVSIMSQHSGGGLRVYYGTVALDSNTYLGVLVCYPSLNKPVVSTKNLKIDKQDYPTGTIFYRYPGESKVIAPEDLRILINDEIERRAALFVQRVKEVQRIGVDNVAMLDTISGSLELPSEKSIMIDESLLESINLIDTGRLVESGGAPAYRIVGNVAPVNTGSIAIRTKLASIGRSDVAKAFLYDKCDNPAAYISAILHDTLKYRPLLYFFGKMHLSLDEAIKYLEGYDDPDVNGATKRNLLQIAKNSNFPIPNHSLIDIDHVDARQCIKSEEDALSVLLQKQLPRSRFKGLIRSAICKLLSSTSSFGYIEKGIASRFMKLYLALLPRSLQQL